MSQIAIPSSEIAGGCLKCQVCGTKHMERKKLFIFGSYIAFIGIGIELLSFMTGGISLFFMVPLLLSDSAGKAAVGFLFALPSLGFLVGSLLGIAVGKLLALKKKILYCKHCGASVQAHF